MTAASANPVDVTERLYEVFPGSTSNATHSNHHLWYWRTRDPHNRKITAVGGEGYANASNARRALRRMYGPGIKITRVSINRISS